MNNAFKPLGMAAAVAAVTAGYAGAVSAQATYTSRALGDLALIPYYTVQSGFATAVHIINTSEHTQVVKLRARRGFDSSDSLDFNLIMSPKDEWVGSLSMKDDESIVWTTNDTTCTAPAGNPTANGGQEFVMPDTNSESLINYREGAEEGYIEVIGMAQPISEGEPIAVAAKHVAGVPRDCAAVRSNFFRVQGAQVPGYVPGTNPVKGVHSPSVTAQTCATATGCENVPAAGLTLNEYTDTQNDAFKVSWAVTDGNSGLEFGSNAVHLEGFAADPMMTNQQVLVIGERDTLGYLFPDLDGGSPLLGVRGLYEDVRAALGASSVQNDWSSRNNDGAFTVATDWVVTMPGQYLMYAPGPYRLSLEAEDEETAALLCNPTNCDYRDIPVGLSITYYDREEGQFTPEEGGLVVSPAVNITPDGIALPYEVNVVEWQKGAEDILGSQYGVSFQPQVNEDRGWADLAVSPSSLKNQAIWNYEMEAMDPNGYDAPTDSPVVNTSVPIIGFAVWERNFANNPAANYGRAIDHSYGSAAMAAPAP
jgi:hypothetical protein